MESAQRENNQRTIRMFSKNVISNFRMSNDNILCRVINKSTLRLCILSNHIPKLKICYLCLQKANNKFSQITTLNINRIMFTIIDSECIHHLLSQIVNHFETLKYEI